MNNTKEHIVCLLDVLGFESLFQRIGLDGIEKKYSELVKAIKDETSKLFILQGPNGHPVVGWAEIESVYFSDSVMYWLNYDEFRMEVLLRGMCELICKSIEVGMPLRGSASIGEIRIKKESNIYLGQPIIDVARAESAQKWIGFTLSKTFELEKYSKGFKADYVLQYAEHIVEKRKDNVIPLVLDFPRHWRLTRKDDLIDYVYKLDIDKRFSKYYTNTIDFINYSKRMHDWWKNEPEYLTSIENKRIKK